MCRKTIVATFLILALFVGHSYSATQTIGDGTTRPFKVEAPKINSNFSELDLAKLHSEDTIQALRDYTGPATSAYIKGHTTAGDGGGGVFNKLSAGGYIDDNGITAVPTGGDGSVAWVREYSGEINTAWYGNTVTASTLSKSALLPEGAYTVPTNASTAITTTQKYELTGLGEQSALTFREDSATGTSEIINFGADNSILRNLKILFTKAQVGVSTAILAKPASNNVVLDNLTIDGGVTLASGTQDRSVQLIKSHPSNNTTGVTIKDSDISNVSRVYTRDNADTSVKKGIKALNNRIVHAWRTVFTINAPAGSTEDVLIAGNTFDTHAGTVNSDSGLSGNNNAVGLVGVNGGRVIGNHVSGKYGAVAHIEENTNGAVIGMNTADMANGGSADAAMEVLASNVGGATVTPQNITHLGNVLKSTDGVGSGFQIQSSVSADGLQWGSYVGNISSGFSAALKTSTDTRSVLITDNVLRGAASGLDLNRASLLARGNVVENSTTPVKVTRGGLMGSVHYVNLSGATAALTAFGSSTAGPLTLTEWTWESDLFEVANGAQYINIGPMPTRIFGRFTIALTGSNGTQHHLAVIETTYDGVTVSNVSEFTYGAGDITINGPAENGGNFAIQITDATGPTINSRIQVKFEGVFVL